MRFDFLIFLGNEAKPEPEKATEIGMDETIVIHNEMEDVSEGEVLHPHPCHLLRPQRGP